MTDMSPEALAQQRESFVTAAKAYYEEVTAATSAGRAGAWRHAARNGVPDHLIRQWDEEAAREVMPSTFKV